VTEHENLPRDILQKRLLLCLYGLGTNTGLKRITAGDHGENYRDLLYVRKRFVTKDNLRAAIAEVVNAIFRVRQPQIWGESTSACASDSKKFGAWDQNLLTEWHIRYRGPGIMVYWHVEKKSVCIYSQIKSCSSSEVAAMIEGVLRHCTDMTVEKNYVDTHGQSEVAFAFCSLLGFQLLPRLKNLGRQKLYCVDRHDAALYANLTIILAAHAINWEIIRQEYDEMVKFATALRLGTADAESILRRFTKGGLQHPTYQALSEYGKVCKTIFLCQYLAFETLRREIDEGLNVIENWNSANVFIFYGKTAEISSNKRDDQEVSILALHLLQISLVYINTLMVQHVLKDRQWLEKLQSTDFRALTPLFYTHVTPYGMFRLNMAEQLLIDIPLAA
jgi:TnpA family transposase